MRRLRLFRDDYADDVRYHFPHHVQAQSDMLWDLRYTIRVLERALESMSAKHAESIGGSAESTGHALMRDYLRKAAAEQDISEAEGGKQ
jgi:predicted secreted Zn-dependent protease